MLLIFERLGDYCEFEIDRVNEKVKFTGSQTNYIKQDLQWRMLWDKCEQHKRNPKQNNSGCKDCKLVSIKQDNETKNLSDKDFAAVFKNQMKVYGFKLKKCQY